MEVKFAQCKMRESKENVELVLQEYVHFGCHSIRTRLNPPESPPTPLCNQAFPANQAAASHPSFWYPSLILPALETPRNGNYEVCIHLFMHQIK